MRGGKHLIVVLNFLLSVPILVFGIWPSTGDNNTKCLIMIQLPLIVIGISMMVISLAGLVGSYYGNRFLLRLYLIAMAVILLFLVGFTIFAYAVTAKGSGKIGRNIGSCLRNSRVCGKIGRTVDGVPETAARFYLRKFSPIQSGCCMPPRECGYVNENGTVWRSPGEGGVVGSNPDCVRWSNDPHLLCYDCDSCTAGVLDTLRKSWRKVSHINIPGSATLGVVYIIALAVHGNNLRKNNCEPCGQTRMIKLQP